MSKKKFNNNSKYYGEQSSITNTNRIAKQAKHLKQHPNDVIKHINPQLTEVELAEKIKAQLKQEHNEIQKQLEYDRLKLNMKKINN